MYENPPPKHIADSWCVRLIRGVMCRTIHILDVNDHGEGRIRVFVYLQPVVQYRSNYMSSWHAVRSLHNHSTTARYFCSVCCPLGNP